MQRLRDPSLLAQAVFTADQRKRAVPDTVTPLSILGALVLLAIVIATATWVPA